jgi:hypothetical protein
MRYKERVKKRKGERKRKGRDTIRKTETQEVHEKG